MKKLTYYINQHKSSAFGSCVSPQNTREVLAFHRGMTGYYAPTPLASLSALSEYFGVAEIFVKDESARFGLNAFKGLGGSYAVAKVLCERLGISMNESAFSALTKNRRDIQNVTFVTATDGNHGRGIAWIAHVLGCRAVVYMPMGSARERLEHIRALGAVAEILSCNYDEAVRFAAKTAEERGWILMQDTAWAGYEKIPTDIMRGYTTLAAELIEQLGTSIPTHLFLQAGVGSFSGAVAGYFREYYREKCPKIIIVEPDKADCLYRSAKAGKRKIVTGSLDSIMAGLCCGEPCTVSWDILKPCADIFVSCADDYAVRGMRILGNPIGDDPKIISGESGAVTAGVLEAAAREARTAFALDEHSRILLISTEGDTDKMHYQSIMEQSEWRK